MMRSANFFLIISDDQDVLDLYVELVRAQRRPVIGVGTCEDALTAARIVPCRAALFDVNADDDWAALARLRERLSRRVPLVVLSGWLDADRTFRNRARELGCAGFVAKPATGTLVVRALQHAAEGSPWSEYVD
jgi:DNA-binding NarL/FixJ family response regulator